VTRPLVALNVPEFRQSPFTVKEPAPDIETVAPLLIWSVRICCAAVISG
jgi:hypothetical protein